MIVMSLIMMNTQISSFLLVEAFVIRTSNMNNNFERLRLARHTKQRGALQRQPLSSSSPSHARTASREKTSLLYMSSTKSGTQPKSTITIGSSNYISSMMDHRLLTKEEDLQLGHYVQNANEVQQLVRELLYKKQQERLQQQEEFRRNMIDADDDFISDEVLYASGTDISSKDTDLDEELRHLSIYSRSSVDYFPSQDDYVAFEEEMEDVNDDFDSYFTKAEEIEQQIYHMENRKQLGSKIYPDRELFPTYSKNKKNKKKKKSGIMSEEDEINNMIKKLNLLDVMDQMEYLSEEDIASKIQIPGGKTELKRTFVRGALAKNELIRCNIKLVVSIAKNWANNGATPSQQRSKNTPLEEAIQEGIVGLAQAAERYDPKRKLRFSTYATYYITNKIRSCYRSNSIGSMRVPPHYHDVVGRYYKYLKENEEPTMDQRLTEKTRAEKSRRNQGEETIAALSKEEEIALKIGVTTRTLRNALRYTQPIMSLDTMESNSFSGSSVVDGGILDSSTSAKSSFAETISSSDSTLFNTSNSPQNLSVMDQMELSLLRQCLENAMATQLNPHERDVIRLRLGLDDGVSRTLKEVGEICGRTKSEINNAEKRAYSKLHSPFGLYTDHLLSFLDVLGIDIKDVSI
eukprot:CAMPEP_0194141012 /NCGR_PEP_ID=MMETSP0152-20130528/10498_1 /TAXON_ID=1049557 /ORGANISM="Thalassiothrix antarctica, Strain L6-D1" /LENGTH=631 /DNA_ID=CAMNT_0038839499 /DNA_START=164 /DNA_END=2059 /DNA_ORIENTATION=-